MAVYLQLLEQATGLQFSAEGYESNFPRLLCKLFEGVVFPDIHLGDENGGLVVIPIGFSIIIGGSTTIFNILRHEGLFAAFPLPLQKGFLDVLFLLLHRNPYDVARFECYGDSVIDTASLPTSRLSGAEANSMNEYMRDADIENLTINRLLLDLLGKSCEMSSSEYVPVQKRIIRVLGATCTAGISVTNLKDFMQHLRYPSELTVSLLKALKAMMKYNNAVAKAAPGSFFNLGGYGAGILSEPVQYPFSKECHFFTWFRVESFTDSTYKDGQKVCDHEWRQHIMTIRNASFGGMDVYIENRILYLAIFENNNVLVRLIKIEERRLSRGVWYHVSIRHGKPRFALLSKDEITVYIDHQLIFQDSVRFPSNLGLVEISVGRNFNGQIGPAYFANELLSSLCVDAIAKMDASKSVDGVPAGSNAGAADLVSALTSSDRKVTNVLSKMETVYHPNRCAYGHALDIHGGRHGRMRALTHSCRIITASDALSSLGGISCLLPLFPRLLIENNSLRTTVASTAALSNSGRSFFFGDNTSSRGRNRNNSVATDDSASSDALSHSNSDNSLNNKAHSPHNPSSSRQQSGLGTSLPEIQADLDCESIFDLIALDGFYIDGGEVNDDGAIGLLLGIVACYISNNKAYQRELVHTRFIEMVVYALTCVSGDIFLGEGDGCVMSIVQLQSLTNEYKLLCDSITKHLLFNFKIWHKGTFSFQSALMSVILSALRTQPVAYMSIITVEALLDYMTACYMDDSAPPRSSVLLAVSSSNSVAEKEATLFRPADIASTPDDSLEQATSPHKKASTAEFLDLSDHYMVENGVDNNNYTLLDVSSIILGGEADSNFIDVSDLCEGDSDPLRGRLMTDGSDGTRVSTGADDAVGLVLNSSVKEAVSKPFSEERLADESSDSTRNNAVEQEIGYVTPEEQKNLRECLQTMVMILVQSGGSDKEMRPFIHFFATCGDLVVLNEMAHLLLYLIVDNGSKVIATVTEVCRGPEEFATLVLHKMISQPHEELRSTGIRILTHFYHSLEMLPVTLLTLTMRKKNLNVMARTMDRISMLTGGRGLQRLLECGGLLLMCDLLSPYMRQSGDLTYLAMLEMLLTKPGSKPLVALEDVSTSAIKATGSFVHNQSKAGMSRSSVLQRAAVFDLSQEHLSDDQSDMINAYVLPSFLQMLPKLPIACYGNCLMNLLGLLKHSSVNRDSFAAEPTWHLSLFGIVSQLVVPIEKNCYETSTSSLVAEINRCSGSFIISGCNSEDSPEMAGGYPSKLSSLNKELPSISSKHDLDTWFSLGMKIYATMLLHCLDYQGGWREVEMALSLSSQRGEERCLSKAILSHVVTELSFSMKTRYKDLQKLSKSKSINDIHKFKDRLENILSLLLSAMQFSLGDQACSSSGVPHFSVGQLRVRCINEIAEELSMKASMPSSLSAEPLSPAAILEMAEERLRNRYRSVSYSDVSSPGELSQTVLVSFDHIWSSPSQGSLSPLDKAGQAHYRVSDTLNPLERQQDTDTGSLTLILQSMRLFDEIFWPSEIEVIRNAHMLRFMKDKFNKELYNSSQSGGDSVTKTENLTLFSGVMRSCLYICQTLSPLVDLASLNVKRMRFLFEGSGTLSRERPITTPVDDWMVAAVLHVTLNLQRVSRSLQPIYLLLGVTEELAVTCSGKESISSNRMFSENTIISKAMENVDLSAKVERFFSSTPAQNLLLYIKSSVEMLADAVNFHKDVLARALNTSALDLLIQFIERYASYNERNTELEVVTNRNSQHLQQEADNLTISLSRTESFASTNSSDAVSVGSGGEDKNDSSNDLSADSLPSTVPPFSFSPTVEPEMNKYLMLALLRMLRDDFLWSDLLRSPKIVMSVSALEGHEVDCGKAFLCNVSSLRYVLEKKSLTPRQKLHEEMRELKDLTGALSAVMTTQEKARLSLKKSVETPQIKTITACWMDCIRTFDASWSPFFSDEPARNGKASVKMSNHHDRRMRHMLMVRTRSSADHTSAAYMEGKKQDQNQYESEGQVARDRERLAPDESQSFLKLNLTTKVGASNSAEVNWGDETESDIDDDDDKADGAVAYGSEGERAPLSSPMGPLGLAGKTVDIIAGIGKSVSTLTIDRRPLWAQSFYWANDEKFQYMIDASQIQVEQTVSGILLLSNKCLYFHPKKQIGGLGGRTKAFKDKRWHLDRLVDLHARRYLLQNSAIELFFADSPEIFFAFTSTQILQKFYRILRRQHAPLLNNTSKSLSPQQVFLNSSWTDLWRRRLISNFEYLMRLNMIAGRSYNDITQYPVFPWVIADYTSKHLDLTNPSVFRDLAKPVGALNPSRLTEILERYNSIDDDIGVPRFMYGSHYSSAGVVIHYMIRQEPYTTLAVSLQGGRFDCPDRNFFDMQSTWNGVNSSLSDVKELIPELFCCPEILLNTNKLPLGELQDGGVIVDDVKLPAWAKDSFDFIRLNREALESDHVSDHLHEWIDLIFGYKQRGAQAEKAYNLFYYLTYDNCAININNIEDPLEREATKSQVTHFGQTPSLLLPKEPHPRRLPRTECMIPLCSDIQNLSNLTIYTPPKQIAADGGHGAAIAAQCSSDRLVIFHADFSLCYYKWSSFPDGLGNPFTLKPDKGRVLTCAPLCLSEDVLRRKSYVPHTLEQKPLQTSLLPPEQDFSLVPESSQSMIRGGVFSPEPESSAEQQLIRTFSDSLNLTSIYGSGEGSSDSDKASSSQRMSSISSIFNLNKIKSVFSGAASTPSPQSSNSRRLSGRMDVGLFFTGRAPGGASPFQKRAQTSSASTSSNSSKVYGCSKRLPIMSHKNVALSVGELGNGRIISVGYWDNSLKVHALDSHREIASNSNGHNGAITWYVHYNYIYVYIHTYILHYDRNCPQCRIGLSGLTHNGDWRRRWHLSSVGAGECFAG